MNKKKEKCGRMARRTAQCPRCHGNAVLRGIVVECSACGGLQYRAVTDRSPLRVPAEDQLEPAKRGADLLEDLMALVARVENSS